MHLPSQAQCGYSQSELSLFTDADHRQQDQNGYATDGEALQGFQDLARLEGILPALESSHAIAHVSRIAGTFPKDAILLVNLSGRGDKDVTSVEQILKEAAHVAD